MRSVIKLFKFIVGFIFWGFMITMGIAAWIFWDSQDYFISGAMIAFMAIVFFFYIVAKGKRGTPREGMPNCPECNSRNYRLSGEVEELDRWRGTKQVEERSASGKKVIRNMQTTYVKNKYSAVCNDCGYVGSIQKKEEL